MAKQGDISYGLSIGANQSVRRNAGDTEFEAYTPISNLDDLTDVVITTPANGQSLTYNGTNWVNSTPSGGGDMTKAVYDPQNIEDDAFDRANHTGTQTVSTITANGNALSWNSDESTLDIPLNTNVTLQTGQETLWIGRNNTGSIIPNGTVVYATGTIGASGRITIAPYIADGSIIGMYTLGITTEDIAVGADGFITHFGKVRGLDTSSFTEGTVLYASPTTAGDLTSTEPSYPNIRIPLAFVVTSHASVGTLAIRVPTVDQNASQVGYDNTTSGLIANNTQDAIDELESEKANDNEVVKLSGNQTIAGVKTFSNNPVVSTGIEIGHASDTTITRAGPGRIAVEGIELVRNGDTPILTSINISNTDTTISRVSAGVIAVEGKTVATTDGTVNLTGNQTIAGVKTFSSSPIVPTPTTDMEVATKKYVDDNAGGGGVSYLIVQDEKSSGTPGGAQNTSNTWFARNLNTIQINQISGASLSSNQITLPAGTYFIRAESLFSETEALIRLYNVTDSSSALRGLSGDPTALTDGRSLEGVITIASEKTFELQYIVDSTGTSTFKLGTPVSFPGENEMYSRVVIQKIS